jgi:hypothetical protein
MHGSVKNILLGLVSFYLASTLAKGQTFTEKRPYVALEIGTLVPTGDYKAMDVGTNVKGGAKPGLAWCLEGAYFFHKHLGAGLRVGQFFNALDTNLLQAKAPATSALTVTDTKTSGIYSNFMIGVGLVPSLPFKRFSLDLKIFPTYLRTTLPDVEVSSTVSPLISLVADGSIPTSLLNTSTKYSDRKGSGWGIELGLGIRAFLTSRWMLNVDGYYLHSSIKVEETVKAQNAFSFLSFLTPSPSSSSSFNMSVTGFGVRLGTSYLLCKPTQTPQVSSEGGTP